MVSEARPLHIALALSKRPSSVDVTRLHWLDVVLLQLASTSPNPTSMIVRIRCLPADLQHATTRESKQPTMSGRCPVMLEVSQVARPGGISVVYKISENEVALLQRHGIVEMDCEISLLVAVHISINIGVGARFFISQITCFPGERLGADETERLVPR